MSSALQNSPEPIGDASSPPHASSSSGDHGHSAGSAHQSYGLVPASAQAQSQNVEIPQAVLNQRASSDQVVINIEDVIAIYRKYLKGAFILGFALAALAFARLQFQEATYSVETIVRLQPGETKLIKGVESMGGNVVSDMTLSGHLKSFKMEATSVAYLRSLYEIISSENPELLTRFYGQPKPPGLLDRIKALIPKSEDSGGGGKPDLAARFVKSMQPRVEVSIVAETHLLRFTFSHNDPEVVAEMANFYTSNFVRYGRQQDQLGMANASDFLGVQIQEVRTSVTEKEKELLEFRRTNGIIDIAKSADRRPDDEVQNLNKEILNAKMAKESSENLLRRITEAAADETKLLAIEDIANYVGISKIREELVSEEANCASLSTQFPATHPQVLQCMAKIKTLKQKLTYLVEEAVQTARINQQQRIEDLAATQKEFQATKEEIISRNEVRERHDRLQQEYYALREMEKTLKDQLNDSQLALKFNDGGLMRIADLASAPENPSSPSLTLSLAGAFVAGMFGLVGFPVLAWGQGYVRDLWNRADPEILEGQKNAGKFAEQVAAEQAAAQETLAIGTQQQTSGGHVHPNHASAPDNGALTVFPRLSGQSVSELIRQATDPSTPHGKNLENAIVRILNTPQHRVLITSQSPGEGKTLTSLALACSAASAGKKVLLVEANEPAPAVDKWIPNESTVPTAMVPLRDAFEAIRTGNSSLYVLSQNSWKTNPELCYQIIDSADSLADLAIFDGPSILGGGNWNFIRELSINNRIIIRNPAVQTSSESTIQTTNELLPGSQVTGEILNEGAQLAQTQGFPGAQPAHAGGVAPQQPSSSPYQQQGTPAGAYANTTATGHPQTAVHS